MTYSRPVNRTASREPVHHPSSGSRRRRRCRSRFTVCPRPNERPFRKPPRKSPRPIGGRGRGGYSAWSYAPPPIRDPAVGEHLRWFTIYDLFGKKKRLHANTTISRPKTSHKAVDPGYTSSRLRFFRMEINHPFGSAVLKRLPENPPRAKLTKKSDAFLVF